MAYFDTTVVISYYCPEKLSVQAEKFILNDDEPTISMLTVVEVVSALSRKVREKALGVKHAESIWKQFDYHRRNHYYIVKPVETAHYLLAATYIQKFNTALRTLDALHLAVADDAGLPIVTVDRQLVRTAEKLGIGSVVVG